jgi:TRAP-type C4-dicarboxylate transport system substrate-binding protein
MPVNEIYNALQSGVTDGAMIDGTTTMAFKLGEVADFLTLGMDMAISPIIMNRDAFDGLSAEHQAAVLKVGQDISVTGNQVQLAEAAKGIAAFPAAEAKELSP